MGPRRISAFDCHARWLICGQSVQSWIDNSDLNQMRSVSFSSKYGGYFFLFFFFFSFFFFFFQNLWTLLLFDKFQLQWAWKPPFFRTNNKANNSSFLQTAFAQKSDFSKILSMLLQKTNCLTSYCSDFSQRSIVCKVQASNQAGGNHSSQASRRHWAFEIGIFLKESDHPTQGNVLENFRRWSYALCGKLQLEQ